MKTTPPTWTTLSSKLQIKTTTMYQNYSKAGVECTNTLQLPRGGRHVVSKRTSARVTNIIASNGTIQK